MPIYEYGCAECGHRLEEQQKMSDPPLVTCPSCGKDRLEKLISATAFQLRGSGWGKDNYSKDPGKKSPRSDSQVSDRLSKAISDDKKKSESSSSASTSSSSSSSSGSSSSDSGSGKTSS